MTGQDGCDKEGIQGVGESKIEKIYISISPVYIDFFLLPRFFKKEAPIL